jgi:hypothetical protein
MGPDSMDLADQDLRKVEEGREQIGRLIGVKK